jgi:LPS export ABC transporter protein LptC
MVSFFGGASGVRAQDDIVNFKVPQVNAQGVIESVMMGERARMQPGKPMDIQELTILFYNDDGKTVSMTVRSPGCRYDAKTREAISEEAVDIQGDGFRVQGVGYTYRMEKEQMEIYNKVRVRLKRSASTPTLHPSRETSEIPDPTPAAP